MAKPDCKGGQNVRLWHIKSRYLPNAVSQSLRIQLTLNSLIRTPVLLTALAPKKPLLTKRREPKPPNSACAEFGTQIAGFKGGKTFQGENPGKLPPQNPGKQSQKAHISGRLPKAPEGGLCLTAGAAGQKNRNRPFFGQSLFLEPGKDICPG